jgi:hypothetical protein
MTAAETDGGPSVRRKYRVGTTARVRLVQRTRILVLAALVATLIATWRLYDQPAHLYPVGANATAWTTDVGLALKELPSGGHLTPRGALRVLPGVGTIVEVVVDPPSSQHRSAVYFLTGVGINDAGLVYLDGMPPPSDTCNYHLGGPWWELSPLNVTSNDCARGFHYTPGG